MAKRPATIPDSELDVLRVLWTANRRRSAKCSRRFVLRPRMVLCDRRDLARPARDQGCRDKRPERTGLRLPARNHAQEVQQKRLKNLVEKLYQGEPGLLVLHLLKSHPLDPKQASEVRAILDEMTTEPGSKTL